MACAPVLREEGIKDERIRERVRVEEIEEYSINSEIQTWICLG